MKANLIGEYRDGYYRKQVIKFSSEISSYNLSPEESGAIFFAKISTHVINLPKISSLCLGITYEFAITEQASSGNFKLVCSKFDSSAIIQTALSSVIDYNTTVTPASTFFTGARVTAVSSVIWMLEQITASGYSFSSAATAAIGGWTTG